MPRTAVEVRVACVRASTPGHRPGPRERRRGPS